MMYIDMEIYMVNNGGVFFLLVMLDIGAIR